MKFDQDHTYIDDKDDQFPKDEALRISEMYPNNSTSIQIKSALTAIWDYSSIFPPPTCKYYNQKDQE